MPLVVKAIGWQVGAFAEVTKAALEIDRVDGLSILCGEYQPCNCPCCPKH